MAVGTPAGKQRAISMKFSEAEFAEIDAIARARGISFTAQVRGWCRVGMSDARVKPWKVKQQ